MTPILDHLLQRLRFYKLALWTFLFLNVLSIVTGLVLTVSYFGSKRLLLSEQSGNLALVAKIDDANMAVQEIKNDLAAAHGKGDLSAAHRKAEMELAGRKDDKLDEAFLWQHFQRVQKANDACLALSVNCALSASLVDTTEIRAQILQAEAALKEHKSQLLSALVAGTARIDRSYRELILTGFLTLLFGILLPGLLVYLINRSIRKVRQEIHSTVVEIVRGWNQTVPLFGDTPFRNVEFWLQILLILGQQMGRLSSHPVAQVSGELAYLVRAELRKSGTSDSAA